MGYAKACFQGRHSVGHRSAARRLLRCYVCIFAISTLRNTVYIPKKLIFTICTIMISQQVNLVAGDFNGTAWRCRSRGNLSTIDDAFSDPALPTPPSLTLLWGHGSIPNLWADVCGFLKPPDSDRFWKVRKHGAFFPRETLGLRLTDLSCHHETWLHLDFVDWNWSQPRLDESDQLVQLKERPTPYQYGSRKRNINDLMSEHSLSS